MRTIHKFRASDDLDRISGLSDNVCGLIVGFLTPREAVATSLLSRRWRYVFACSPSLDFDYSLFPKTRRRRKQAFVDFVDRTLGNASGTELRKFRLHMEEYAGYEPRVEDWIGFAVEHEVQELELNLPRGRRSKVPDTVFGCASITHLKLSVGNYAFELPSPAGLENLRSLEIKSASLPKGEFVKELFARCSLLEELVVENCRIDGALEIESERLGRLTMCCCNWVGPVQVKVSAPRLRCFNYIGAVADDHCFEHFGGVLEEAVLNLSAPAAANRTDEERALSKLLQMVGGAKVLTLSPWCIQQLLRAAVPSLPRSLQGQGESVKELELLLERKEDCIQVMAPVLAYCPTLEGLSVYILPSKSLLRIKRLSNEERKRLQKGARGAMKQMKKVTLEFIDESKTGLELVGFLLKNAPALEKMKIIPSNDGLECARFKQEVSKLQRACRRTACLEYCSAA